LPPEQSATVPGGPGGRPSRPGRNAHSGYGSHIAGYQDECRARRIRQTV